MKRGKTSKNFYLVTHDIDQITINSLSLNSKRLPKLFSYDGLHT